MAGTPQVIVGGGQDGVSGGTIYGALFGGNWTSFSDRETRCVVPHAGTLQNFKMVLTTAPGAGTSYTFTIYVNGVASDITITIADTDTTGEDTVHTASVSAGDWVHIQSDAPGPPWVAASYPYWSIEFDPDTANDYWIGGAFQTNTTLTRYGAPYTHNQCLVSEAGIATPIPVSGTLKNLYIRLSADPGTSPDAYRFTLRVNQANSSLTCAITANDTTGNDTGNTVSVSAGDLIDIMCEPLNTPSATAWIWWGMTISLGSNHQGMSPVMGTSIGDDPASGATEFLPTAGGTIAWGTEATKFTRVVAEKVQNLYVNVETAPGAGKSHTFTIRHNEADSALTVTISDTNTSESDTTHSFTPSDGDRIGMEATPSGTPSTTDPTWGFTIGEKPGPTNVDEFNSVAAPNIDEVNGVPWNQVGELDGVG